MLSSFLIDALQTTAVNATDARPQNTPGHAPKFPARIKLGSIDLRKFLKQTLTPNGSHVTGYWMDGAGVHGDHIRSSYGPRIPGAKELNDTYPAMELSGSDASFSSSEDNIRVFGWHGDIKPENMLSFAEDMANEHRLLVFTNFGLPTLDINYRLFEAVAAPDYNSHVFLLWASMPSNPPGFPPVPNNYPPNVLTLYGSRNVKIAEACAVKTYHTPSRKANASNSSDVVSRCGMGNEQDFDRAKEYTNFQSLLFQNSIMPESAHQKPHSSHGHDHGHKLENRSIQIFQGDGGLSTVKMKNKTPEYCWEWFWSCCYCNGHGAMSTFIEQCPGCNHLRCVYCAIVSVEI